MTNKTKKWYESRTIRLAILQGLIAVITAFLTEVPEIQGVALIAMFKSTLDVLLRIETNQPLKG